jgi:hypothetical protein
LKTTGTGRKTLRGELHRIEWQADLAAGFLETAMLDPDELSLNVRANIVAARMIVRQMRDDLCLVRLNPNWRAKP